MGHTEGVTTPIGYRAAVRSQWASPALVLGVIGLFTSWFLFGLPSIVAILCGHATYRDIRRSGGRLSGASAATAGLVLGYPVAIASLAVIIGIVVNG